MYNIIQSSKFKKDLKAAIKRGYNISLLDEVVTTLAKGENLPPKNKDHFLSGNYNGCRECHIQTIKCKVYKVLYTFLILNLVI